MTDQLVEPGPEHTMTDEEALLAEQVYAAIMDTATTSERSQQQADFRLGISDLGFCSEKVRRMIAGIPEPVTDKLAAFLGIAIGDHVEQAVLSQYPNAIRQAEVKVEITGDGGTYTVTGHPDLVFPHGLVLDIKTTRGLAVVRRTGPTLQQQFQRHLYGLGAYLGNLFSPQVTLDDVKVANVWIDRAGDTHEAFCHMEPYAADMVTQAAFWLDDVAYAFVHDEEARKEPPRELCWAVCGHAPDCRGRDTDVQGLITDTEVLAAVDLHIEANALAKKASAMKDEAKSHLLGVAGSTGKYAVRWVHVNGGHVEYDRNSYERLDVKPLR